MIDGALAAAGTPAFACSAIITADAATSTSDRLLARGATMHMTKPIDIRMLVDVVRKFTQRGPQ